MYLARRFLPCRVCAGLRSLELCARVDLVQAQRAVYTGRLVDQAVYTLGLG